MKLMAEHYCITQADGGVSEPPALSFSHSDPKLYHASRRGGYRNVVRRMTRSPGDNCITQADGGVSERNAAVDGCNDENCITQADGGVSEQVILVSGVCPMIVSRKPTGGYRNANACACEAAIRLLYHASRRGGIGTVGFSPPPPGALYHASRRGGIGTVP